VIDYASKVWLRRSPVMRFLLALRMSFKRKLSLRRAQFNDPIRFGVRWRLEDGLLYVEPMPAPRTFEV
jgi:hypothetical protein